MIFNKKTLEQFVLAALKHNNRVRSYLHLLWHRWMKLDLSGAGTSRLVSPASSSLCSSQTFRVCSVRFWFCCFVVTGVFIGSRDGGGSKAGWIRFSLWCSLFGYLFSVHRLQSPLPLCLTTTSRMKASKIYTHEPLLNVYWWGLRLLLLGVAFLSHTKISLFL